jgi:hypothetical protein
MRRSYFRSGTLPNRSSSVHVTLSLPAKRPIRADMALVAHALNILPDRVTSGHVTSGSATSNDNLSVPIYYLYEAPDRTILHLVENKIQAGGRPRHTPVQNYGVHFIKPQLRPCQTSVVQVFQKLVCLQPLTDPTSYWVDPLSS